MCMETTKPKSPRTVRGTATIHDDDRIEFKPYGQGETTQKNLKACRGGKLFTTTSETKPLQVAHLSCPANAADPYAAYLSQLEKLGVKPQEAHPMPARQRLVNDGGMEVFLNARKGVLTYQGCIDLTATRNWQSDLMRQLQIIVRTLPGEEKFKRVINKIKKGGQHV